MFLIITFQKRMIPWSRYGLDFPLFSTVRLTHLSVLSSHSTVTLPLFLIFRHQGRRLDLEPLDSGAGERGARGAARLTLTLTDGAQLRPPSVLTSPAHRTRYGFKVDIY
jgi:hypothetical protein